MKLGLQIPSFSWQGGPERLGSTLRDIARNAEDAGYDSIWVMDHFFQIRTVGSYKQEMLKSYSTLAHIATPSRTRACRPPYDADPAEVLQRARAAPGNGSAAT